MLPASSRVLRKYFYKNLFIRVFLRDMHPCRIHAESYRNRVVSIPAPCRVRVLNIFKKYFITCDISVTMPLLY